MFFLSAFFFFCRHVFLLCLFLGVSLIFSCSDLLSDGTLFACPVSLSPLCLFHGFSAFCAIFICDFSLFKFFCMDFSAWFRFLDSDFFTWRIIFFSSCSSLLFRSCASFPVRGFSAFMLFRRTFSFFAFSGTALLFSDSTRKCLFPFNAHLRLNRIRCRRVTGLFFPQSLQKVRSSFIYTAFEGNRQVPVSTLRQSRFIRFAEIPHVDCPSNPNTLPSCRLSVFKVCFRFFRNLCVFRGLSLKVGIFCLLNRFFIDSFLLPYPFPFFVSLFVKLFFTL